LHNQFRNWVRDQDIVGTNQLAQEYKDNTISFYGNSAADKDNTTVKTMNPVRVLGIAY
jgi:hypothetical protein